MVIWVVKAVMLLILTLLVVPVVFFVLVGLFGKYFVLTIDHDSWLAKSNRKLVQWLLHKFIV